MSAPTEDTHAEDCLAQMSYQNGGIPMVFRGWFKVQADNWKSCWSFDRLPTVHPKVLTKTEKRLRATVRQKRLVTVRSRARLKGKAVFR